MTGGETQTYGQNTKT